MGSFKVKRLNLKKSIIEAFERQNLRTCEDVLCLTVLELQSLLGISYKEALKIQNVASEKCVSDPCTICGPPGVGKTQFCFLLSLLATLRTNMGGQVIYIDTESAFSAQRLKTMALKKYPELFKTEEDISYILQHISVYRASTVGALKEIVPNIEKEIIKKNVKLVIVDSIASLFRKEYGASGLQSVMERNNILVEQAALLKDIAQTYGIVVFLTNQVTSHSADWDSLSPEISPTEENDDEGEPLFDEPPVCKKARRLCVVPALGITWSHCVTTRLVARFLGLQVCQLTVAKSPVAPNAAVKYVLNEAGFVVLDDVEYVNRSDQNILPKNHFLTEEITGPGIF